MDRQTVSSESDTMYSGCRQVNVVGFKMVNVILSLSLLLPVVFITHGQSTAGDNSGCVYSFKVRTSDCAQTPGPSVDDQIWKSSVIALQEQVRQLTSDMRVMREHNNKLVSDVGSLQTKLARVTTGRDINRIFCSLGTHLESLHQNYPLR